MVGPVGHGGGGDSSSAGGASRNLAGTEGIGSLASRACVTDCRRGLSAARHTATMQAHATEKRDTENGGMRVRPAEGVWVRPAQGPSLSHRFGNRSRGELSTGRVFRVPV